MVSSVYLVFGDAASLPGLASLLPPDLFDQGVWNKLLLTVWTSPRSQTWTEQLEDPSCAAVGALGL